VPTPVTTATVTPAAALNALQGQLTVAAQACRRSRVPLSLMMVSVDDISPTATATKASPANFTGLTNYFESFDHHEKLVVPLDEKNWAVVFLNCDRQQVSQLAHGLVHVIGHGVEGQKSRSLGLGAATATLPAKNFDVNRLVEAAERCCSASRMAGGNVLKSIEIF
jgi:hypothetical protein